ncbi:RHS repeat-associated core domain-containing protein [Acinetobacter sp. ESBL14]|uniref:RHS repeat-associated core domain-containing protein n=1 Tax=Acinetobacter sp. ESBL14 TaxID=3077329 RepID=UPI002FC7B3F8
MTTKNIEQIKEQRQSVVQLAIFNLESITDVADLQMTANQIQHYLNVYGNTSLQQLKSGANIPTVANIFALTESILGLLHYTRETESGDVGVQQVAILGANLIGLFVEPYHQAHVRMALRPMLGLMADSLYSENGKITSAQIKRLSLHLNAMIAGDLEKFLHETQMKLPELLEQASVLATTILQSFVTAPSGTSFEKKIIATGVSAEKRDPKLKFTNWAVPLIHLLEAPTQTDISTKIETQKGSSLIQGVTQALTTLDRALQQQANVDQKYTLAWLIQECLNTIQTQNKKTNASVPANQTGEHEQHTNGDILEFLSLQIDAINAPPCSGTDSQSENSIRYSIGTEQIQDIDFYLTKIDFTFSRQYNSQRDGLDLEMIGARWITPFSYVITQNTQGYLFIDAMGRKHQLPSSIITSRYSMPFERFSIEPLEDGDLILNVGTDWDFYFHSFNQGKSYQLIQQLNQKTEERIQFNYLLINQLAYLQAVDFQFKRAKQTLKFAFNDQVKIIAIFVDEQPEPLARYEYDIKGNLLKAYDQNGYFRQYEYNHAHQLTRYTDRTGRGHNIRYDSTAATARAIEEWADDGSFHTTLKWHPRLRQVTVFDAYDTPTYYYFDLHGFTYRIRLADGRESWYSRDKQKRITRQIDFEGRETQQEYNDLGQLAKIIQPNGGVIRFAYDVQGHLSEIKDPEGNIWKREYDTQGNLSKEINPQGLVTQYKYNNDNQLIELTDAIGGTKKFKYNDLGQILSYTDCSGKSSHWDYDETSQLKSQLSAEEQRIEYQYSTQGKDKGQLQTIVYPDGLNEHFEHDEEGRPLKHTDTKGLITRYQYNTVGLLERRVDANHHQIRYQWDKKGRIHRLFNQNQAVYQFDYNHYGQLIREQAFDGEEKHFIYNENGQLFQIQQSNIQTQFYYHADGHIASKDYIDLETRQPYTETFEYNLNQQLSKVSNGLSQIDLYYDALGQLVREHQHYKIPDHPALTAVLRYEYDELGHLIKTIRPDGQIQTHLNYGAGHVYGIAFNKQEMVAFQRDGLHRERVRLLANGLIQTKQYNQVGLLCSQRIDTEQDSDSFNPLSTAKYHAERHYQYDKNYLITEIDDSRLGKFNYQYDPVGRLITSLSPFNSERFNFDPAGNLIESGQTQVNNNLIRQYQGRYYQYDARGNLIELQQKGKSLKLTWDHLNRLIQSDHNGKITEYGYDVFGRRLFKKNQNSLTLFGWEGDVMTWEAEQNFETGKSYTKHYVYEPNSFTPLFQTGYSNFIRLVETPDYKRYQTEAYSIAKDPLWKNDTRINKAELERVAFYHCDQVGTPQCLTNERGEAVWEITLNTWGKTLNVKAFHPDNPFEHTHLRFQGQYFDQETGLHYNRHRYYEPFSARYISKDPLGLEGGIHTSAYVRDPNQWVDPMGLMAEKNKNANQSKYERYSQDFNRRNAPIVERQRNTNEQAKVARGMGRNDFPVMNNKPTPSPGLLGNLFPNTMSAFAKDPALRRDLRNQGAINNTVLGAAVVAGYGPYVVAGAATGGGAVAAPIARKAAPYLGNGATLPSAGLSAETIAKAAGASAAAGGVVDVVAQSFTCLCVTDINLVRTGGVAATSAVTGAWGASTSAAAGFGQVGWSSIALNAPKAGSFIKNNASGFLIFANEQVIGQASSRAVKAATAPKDEQSKK